MKQYRNVQNTLIDGKNAQCVKYGMPLKIMAMCGSMVAR